MFQFVNESKNVSIAHVRPMSKVHFRSSQLMRTDDFTRRGRLTPGGTLRRAFVIFGTNKETDQKLKKSLQK